MYLLAQTGLTTAVFVGLLVLTTGLLLARANRYFGRRNESQPASYGLDGSDSARKGHHLEAPQTMVRWEVEMQELGRELSGQIDTKMGLLQQLVREADRAAARLEAALAAAERARATVDSDPASLPDSANRERLSRIGEGASQAEALRAAGAGEPRRSTDGDAPAGSVPPPSGAAGARTSSDPAPSQPGGERRPPERRFQEIYALADRGFDAAEIAQRIDTPVGEVELILGLRDKR